MVTKRGIVKLARLNDSAQDSISQMLDPSIVRNMFSSNFTKLLIQNFEAINLHPNETLDFFLTSSIRYGNKDIADYIITNNKFNPEKCAKYFSSPDAKNLVQTYLKAETQPANYWQIAALLECGMNLEEGLRNISPFQQAEIIKSAAKNGYGVAIKTLIEEGYEVSYAATFQCAANMKYKDAAKQEELTRDICPNFADVKKNFSAAFKENFAKDLKEAKSAEEINSVINAYSQVEQDVNIPSGIDFAKVKEQKLNERSLFTKVKDFFRSVKAHIKTKILNEKVPDKILQSAYIFLGEAVRLATKKTEQQSTPTPSEAGKELEQPVRIQVHVVASSQQRTEALQATLQAKQAHRTPAKRDATNAFEQSVINTDGPAASSQQRTEALQATLQARQAQSLPATHTLTTHSAKSAKASKKTPSI